MNTDQITQKIRDVVADELDLSDLELTPDTQASDVEGWDSLAHLRIMLGLEQSFGVRFDVSEISSVENIGGLVALIRSKVS